MTRRLLALLCLLTAPAGAAELRDFCPTRPGLGTNACTVDPGHVVVEVSAIDWTHDRDGTMRSDEGLVGDSLARIGIGTATELQIGWTPFGWARERDGSGSRNRQRIGDVTLALRQNLRQPDGSGVSLAVQPFVTLPTGRRPIGAGDWGAGLVVPLTVELSDDWSFELTPEADAAVDEDGSGRHLAFSAVTGVSRQFGETLTATFEIAGLRDDDPGGHETQWRGAQSLAWQPKDDLQFDVQAVEGLNHGAPDIELIVGVARRF